MIKTKKASETLAQLKGKISQIESKQALKKANPSLNRLNTEQSACLKKALNRLALRDHSLFEMKRKLKQLDFDNEVIEFCIQWLLEQNYLNEDRFCQSFISSKVRVGYGSFAIKKWLKDHHIPSDMIEKSLKTYQDQWVFLAKNFRDKKFGGSIETLEYSEKMKQMRTLNQKGFDTDTIHQVFKTE